MLLAAYICAGALLCAQLLLWRQGRTRLAAAAFALACACLLGAAWLGTDFSPSFTMLLMTANLLLCALAECAALAGRCLGRGGGALAALCGILFGAGMLLALPSVYIYAAGDDLLARCEIAAAVTGALLTAGLAFAGRRRGRQMRLSGAALNWLALSAACFALACGLRSPALLAYGAGLLCFCAARTLKPGRARAALFCAGLALASLFAVGPML